MVIGHHDKPIKCVEYSPETNTVVTGSWDNTLKLWDPRSPGGGASTFPQPEKVTSLIIAQKHVSVVRTNHSKAKLESFSCM